MAKNRDTTAFASVAMFAGLGFIGYWIYKKSMPQGITISGIGRCGIARANKSTMTIREYAKIKKDEPYFRLVDKNGKIGKPLYFINFYERSLKKYSISKYDDVNYERFVSPNQLVTTLSLEEDFE